MKYVSPLRYPGGKARLAPFLSDLLKDQEKPLPHVFVEPFAGGAGAGLSLLQQGVVEHLVLNDANPGIAAFWSSVLYHTDEFCDLIRSTSASLENWYRTKSILDNPLGVDTLTLGFAAFFLNRTNHSGIIEKARPIGGLKQDGKYKIDARYNVDTLISRVRNVAALGSRIEVYQRDGVDFLRDYASVDDVQEVFAFVDPPYVVKGRQLYEFAFTQADHERLASVLRSVPFRWVLTYDDSPVVRGLYPQAWCSGFGMPYSVSQSRCRGRELMVFSEGVVRGSRVGDDIEVVR
jgi:DNA-methyltransferase